MKGLAWICVGVVAAALPLVPPRDEQPRNNAAVDWRALSDAGQHSEALRALDTMRKEVIERYKADLLKVFPRQIADFTAEEPYDNSASIQIAILQTYSSETAEVRVDLKVPTVDVDRMAAVSGQLGATIRRSLNEGRQPPVVQGEAMLLHGFPALIRREGVFFDRPQLQVHLSMGAQVVLHATKDIDIGDFRAIAEELPLSRIDEVIRGRGAPDCS